MRHAQMNVEGSSALEAAGCLLKKCNSDSFADHSTPHSPRSNQPSIPVFSAAVAPRSSRASQQHPPARPPPPPHQSRRTAPSPPAAASPAPAAAQSCPAGSRRGAAASYSSCRRRPLPAAALPTGAAPPLLLPPLAPPPQPLPPCRRQRKKTGPALHSSAVIAEAAVAAPWLLKVQESGEGCTDSDTRTWCQQQADTHHRPPSPAGQHPPAARPSGLASIPAPGPWRTPRQRRSTLRRQGAVSEGRRVSKRASERSKQRPGTHSPQDDLKDTNTQAIPLRPPSLTHSLTVVLLAQALHQAADGSVQSAHDGKRLQCSSGTGSRRVSARFDAACGPGGAEAA